MLMTRLRRILLPTLVPLAFAPVLLGAELAADLNVQPAAGGSFPAGFVVYDGALYFTAFAPLVGTELWRTDGTAAGAELFLDLLPGRGSSGPRELVVFRGRLYFLAEAEPFRPILFATDGTREGTERIVEVPNRGNSVWPLVATANALYFIGWTAEHGSELFTSDGTRAGTRLLAGELSVGRGMPPLALTPLGDELFFVTDDGVHGLELWSTDGSAAGTVLVRDVFAGSGSALEIGGVERLAVHDGALYFGADSGSGSGELWTSDGSAAGTRLVHRFEGVPQPCLPRGASDLAATADGSPVFAGSTAVGGELSSGGDCELWVSDAGGTRLLVDLEPGSASSSPRSFTAAGGKVFFTARTTAHGQETWVTDGTVGGTGLVRDIDPGGSGSFPERFLALGERLVFSASHPDYGKELWTTDGTEEGTFLLRDIGPGRSGSAIVLWPDGVFDGRLYFGADDHVVGNELWATDGTAAGTVLVAVLNDAASSSDPTGFTVLGERLLVQTAPQQKLWSVGGENAEVVLEDSGDLFRAGDAVFFQRRFDGELWSSDGTAAGSQELAPFGCLAGMASFQDRAFFLALENGHDDGSAGLWTSDATAAETFQVTPVPLPGFPGFGMPGQFCPQPRAAAAVAGGELFFAAQNYLLRTDGTTEGTRIVAPEGCPPVSLANGEEIVAVGDVIFYSIAPPGARRVLVRLGTAEACPVALRELDSLPDTETFLEGAFPPRRPRLDTLTPVGDRLFFVAETEDLGVELWTSDGTAGGTRPVRDLRPGSAGSEPRDLLALDGRLLFTAADAAHGRELWASDGTSMGTALVVDLFAGARSSSPQGLAEVDGLAVFAASDGEHGLELWRSDGTPQGTWLVDDVQPGPLSSSPRSLTALGDRLYMNAGTVETGFEVFSVARDAIFEGPDDGEEPGDPCPSCLRGGRFTVEVRWKNQHDGGTEGTGQPLRFSDETVLFWFFKESNVELILKVLDGRRINGHFWVFYGGLSDVEYWITVTDTFDGAERTYHNPPGGICGQGDTRAF